MRAAVGRAHENGADYIVVLAHWGDEYTPEPPARLRQRAATFAASGADLVIGTHSHVIGESEDIGTTRVYYSLGNFIFDQYWDESVRCGLAIEVVLTKMRGRTTPRFTRHLVHLERTGATTLGCPSVQNQDTLN